MIETYKILTGKCDMVAVPNLSMFTTLTTKGDDFRLRKTVQHIIFTNAFLLTQWLTCGVVCLIVFCMLNLLMYLINDYRRSILE